MPCLGIGIRRRAFPTFPEYELVTRWLFQTVLASYQKSNMAAGNTFKWAPYELSPLVQNLEIKFQWRQTLSFMPDSCVTKVSIVRRRSTTRIQDGGVRPEVVLSIKLESRSYLFPFKRYFHFRFQGGHFEFDCRLTSDSVGNVIVVSGTVECMAIAVGIAS